MQNSFHHPEHKFDFPFVKFGRLALEGDGWVNWSGLATLLAGLGNAIDLSLNRVLSRVVLAR